MSHLFTLQFRCRCRRVPFGHDLHKIPCHPGQLVSQRVTFSAHRKPKYQANQDLEREPHPRVLEFKSRIRAADAILIATPEYNYSIPGVLKNAIDCASRPYGDSAWTGKPVAIMGASVGGMGTARAQYHLRQCFVFLNMYPVNRPEVMIRNASERFDSSGRLTDETSRELIGELLANWLPGRNGSPALPREPAWTLSCPWQSRRRQRRRDGWLVNSRGPTQ
jgi:NAD(P)H-dependent FMN reductase